MALPLQHLDVAAIETVPQSLWTTLFSRIGWPGPLAPGFANHVELVGALHADEEPSVELLQALECLRTLGTERGRRAILEAAADRHIEPDWAGPDSGAQELAMELFVRQLDDGGLHEVYARAQLHLHEADTTRKIHELDGKQATVPADIAGTADRLADRMRAFCLRRGLGDYVEVRYFEDNGAFVYHVVHSHHLRTPLAVTEDGRGVIRFRPVHDDILRFDAATGRLRIVARSSRLAAPYAHMAGSAFFSDPEFFCGEVWDLTALQEGGRSLLERHGVPEVGRIWMTECTWVRGERERHCLFGLDCFTAIEELSLPIIDGKLTRVKLKMQLTRRSARPVTVVVTPRDCTISDASHDRLVNACLEKLGLRAGATASPEMDLWGLRPWKHRREVWFTLFGRQTDDLVREGILVPTQLQAAAHPDFLADGPVLEVHPLPGGDFYGLNDRREIPTRTFSATDLDALQLNPAGLAAHLHRALSLDGQPGPWVAGSELLDLGMLRVEEASFRLLYVVGPPRAELGSRAQHLAGGRKPVLLVPPGRSVDSDLCVVRLESAMPLLHLVRRAVVVASGMERDVPALHLADAAHRLVVDTLHGRIWFDAIPVPLKEDAHAFKLVLALARARPEPVEHTALAKDLNGARKDDNTVVRQAKAAANKAIRLAITDAGREPPKDVFPTAGVGAYRCVVPAFVR